MKQEVAAPAIEDLTYVSELGVGGFAHVYLYEQQLPRMKVAVKVLDSVAIADDARRQLASEANAMAELGHHPHIVQVFRAGVTADGRSYIVMKYYPRENYGIRLRSHRFPVSDVLSTGIEIASAVETAHRAGILHCDIKPANILADDYGNPALTDFGIAAVGEPGDDGPVGMSLPWAPPELAFSEKPPSARSDVYSLAATLWNLLVGRSPFEEPGGDNSQPALMRRIRSTPPPSTGRGDVPQSLDRLLQMAMAKEPAQRPSTAAELARGLQAVEQQLRLPVTPLVLADDGGGHRPSTPQGPEDTVGRPLQRIEAQPIVNAVPRTDSFEATDRRGRPPLIAGAPSGSVAETEDAAAVRGRERVIPPPSSAVDGTVRRPGVAARDEPAPSAETSRRRRWWLGAALAVVVLVAAGGAVVLSGGGDKAQSQSSTSAGSGGTPTEPKIVISEPPPGTPAVQASRIDVRHVRFTWAGYTNRLRSDSYRYRLSGTGRTREGVASTPSLVVATGKGEQACLAVQVVRENGSSPSSLSDPTCG